MLTLMLSRYCRARWRMRRRDRTPTLPRVVSSRLRKRFSYTVSWGTSARSWYTVSMPTSAGVLYRVEIDLLSLDEDPALSGRWNPHRILTKVLLPAPLSPTRPRTSPRLRCMSIPRSATTAPKRFVMLRREGPYPVERRRLGLRPGRRWLR